MGSLRHRNQDDHHRVHRARCDCQWYDGGSGGDDDEEAAAAAAVTAETDWAADDDPDQPAMRSPARVLDPSQDSHRERGADRPRDLPHPLLPLRLMVLIQNQGELAAPQVQLILGGRAQ